MSEKNKAILTGIAIVSLLTIVIVSLLRDRLVNQPYNSVNVIGRGIVQYDPDTAVIVAGVNYSSNISASVIQVKYTELFDRLVDRLGKLEDVEVEVYPSSANINSNIDPNNSEKPVTDVTGNYQVVIKVKNITTHKKSVERVLERITKEGINQIISVSYTMSNLDDIRQQAWAKAYDALEKNKTAIEAKTNLKLSKIMNWYETIISTGDNGMNNYYGGYPSQTLMPREYVLEINSGYRIEEGTDNTR
jgi:uncharacterized protein YggE